jgi:hypothetical protein
LLACLASSTAIPEPYVCPTRSGGVQFEWERGSRYFEVEVVGRFAAEYYFSDTDERSVATGEVFDGELLDPIVEFIHKVEAAAS